MTNNNTNANSNKFIVSNIYFEFMYLVMRDDNLIQFYKLSYCYRNIIDRLH